MFYHNTSVVYMVGVETGDEVGKGARVMGTQELGKRILNNACLQVSIQ